MTGKIVLGTRGSDLALRQAALVVDALHACWPGLEIKTTTIVTKGDNTRAPMNPAGWKGFFTAEIESALQEGAVDLAVHSAKDLPSQINSGTEIAAVLPRASTFDVLVSKTRGGLAGLPSGATIGTSSVRRIHQLKWRRPDISIVELRGNVPTRVRKLGENKWDAIVLAKAGLDRLRLSLNDWCVETLDQAIFLPAGGQGIIAVQIRSDDVTTRKVVLAVNDDLASRCLRAEREFLRLLNVDCNAPVAVLATIEDQVMKMRGQYFDGSAIPNQGMVEGAADQGEVLAAQLFGRIGQRT